MADLLAQDMRRVTDSIAEAQGNEITAPFMSSLDQYNGLDSVKERGIQAGILNNFRRAVMDSIDAPAPRGAQVNMMQDFGPYIPEVLPIVAAWYPEFPLRDLISVQDMNQDLAYLFFSKFVAGTNKAPTIVGQVVETPTGMRNINGYYPTGEILGETIPADQLEVDEENNLIGVTAYFALNTSGDYMSKFKIDVFNTADNSLLGSLVASGVSGNTIALKPIDAAGSGNSYMTIDNGLFSIAAADLSAAPADGAVSVSANYVWNLDYAIEENIPKVKELVEKIEMRAVPRAIGMYWTVFAEALRKSQFNQDIRSENTKRVLNLLYQYQVRYVLDTMWTYATGGTGTITIPQSTSISLDVQAANIMQQLNQYATQIELSSGFMEGNRLVVGKNFKAFLESLPNTWYKPVAQESGWSTAREIGQFGKFKVYYDPWRADDAVMMSWRGSEFWAAPFIMGMFLPVTTSDVFTTGVTSRMSMYSMEAYKYWRPDTVIKLKAVYE